jgi:hypothetical protein
MSTGAARVAASWPHPAATSPVEPTAGWSTSTRRPWPRSRPPCGPGSTPTGPPGPGQPAQSVLASPSPGHAYGRTVLAAELATLGRATPGHRNRTLNRCAFKVYRYVGGGVLDDQDVTLSFTSAALAIGLDRAEIGRTLASARTAGLANPRTVPTGPDPSRLDVGS